MEEELKNEEMKKAYSEVIAVLRLIDDDDKFGKLPMEFVELIRSKADPSYMPELSKEKPIEEQNLRNETYSILAWIASKYWNEELYETVEESIEKKQEIEHKIEPKIEVSVYNDIEEECLEPKEKNDLLPIAMNDLNWFERIKLKVKMLLEKIFKRNRKEDFEYTN